MVIQNFDLHIHSTFSDGEYSVVKIIEKLKEKKIEFFSITDHDDIESIKTVKQINIGDIKYIPGIEISALYKHNGKSYKMHILGYNIDENNEDLLNLIEYLKTVRKKRFYEIANYLQSNYHMSFDSEELNQITEAEKTPGKPHIASLMVKKGYVENVSEAFAKYLENVKTVTSNRIDALLAIQIIKKAGGVAIWAHPKKVEKEYDIDFKYLLGSLIEDGLDGIELYNCLHSYEDSERYRKAAEEKGLIESGGSDYHGEKVKPNVHLGVIYNSDENKVIKPNKINLLKKERKQN